jgi:hypothetical protein
MDGKQNERTAMIDAINRVKQQETADRTERMARYRSILEILSEATEPQIAELRNLMSSLGFSAAKMEADARAIADRKKWAELATALPSRDAIYQDASRKHAKLVSDTARSIKALQDEERRSLDAVHKLERAKGESNFAARNLMLLERSNWELLGLPDPQRSGGFQAGPPGTTHLA